MVRTNQFERDNEGKVIALKRELNPLTDDVDFTLRAWLSPIGSCNDWLTTEQAAKFLGVTERVIDEQYRPRMPEGTFYEAEYEYKYWWEFEGESYTWDTENLAQGSDRIYLDFHRAETYYPELETQPGPDDEVSGEWFAVHPHHGTDYDPYLEPERKNVCVRPRLYLSEGLLAIRGAMAANRTVRKIPQRGSGGRFMKAS